MIRTATANDLPAIARMIRALAAYEKMSDRVVFKEDQLRQHLFGEKPYAEVLIAEDDGRAVGFALFFHNYSTFRGQPGIYLEDLFVEPHCRGKGHGKALLLSLARLAVQRQCGKLEWEVLDWNEPAIGFYKKLGAVRLAEWHIFQLADDALLRAGGGTV
jgi:GNAT superfamily N-acetyltransferase